MSAIPPTAEAAVALAQHASPWISREEYLEGEKIAEVKHEYVQGEVYALAGVSLAHSCIAGNLNAALTLHLRGSPCRSHQSDVKVLVDEADAFYYPDVVVDCHAANTRSTHVLTHPRVIAEVLSPSTEDVDRSRKFLHYRALASLTDYILIAQDRMHVEHYHRESPTTWILKLCGAGDTLDLAGLGFSCPIDDLYSDVTFDEPEPAPSA